MISKMIDNRNGMRQPHASKLSVLIKALLDKTTMIDRTNPPTTLAWMKLV